MTDAARRRLRRVPWALPAVVAALAAMVAVGAAVIWWDWWRSASESSDSNGEILSDSNGETLRTLALILGAIVGLFFAWWRNRTADRQAETANRQAETANEQAKTANRQAETAEHGLRNERFQKGADMLGNATLATRLGGIYALEQLAREHPEEYHILIVKLLCDFIRHPAEDRRPDEGGADTEAAAQAIGRRRVEKDPCEFVLNLEGAHLSGTRMCGTNLRSADLWRADLSGANLWGVRGLKQSRLNEAIIREGEDPPQLGGALDAVTGEPLAWQGEERPPEDEAGD